MGRKRIKHEVEQELLMKQSLQMFDIKDDDGLYPFSNVFRWRPQNGKAQGTLVSLTLDAECASEKELSVKGDNIFRFFYSEFTEQYCWAVKALARGLKTFCLNNRISHSEGSYCRNSIGKFLKFCRDEKISLDSFEDLNFQLLCRWRNDLRSVQMQSRYKNSVFRRFCKVLESLMGTSEFPVQFSVPIYRSDAPEHLAPYSDAIMYQLIAAATSDIENIMSAAEIFQKLIAQPEIANSQVWTGLNNEYDWKRIVVSYLRDGCSARSFLENGRALEPAARAEFYKKLSLIKEQFPDAYNEFNKEINLVASSGEKSGLALRRLDEKEIPSRDSLFPFFLLFIISSGANKESIYTWQRNYEVNGRLISPLDWKDPFDPTKCRLRGIKFRGKGKLVSATEDFWVQISDEGLYPILKFLLWYTEPLSVLAEEKSKLNLWLYKAQNKPGVLDFYELDVFSTAASEFLTRHEIWDLEFDAQGELQKTRITSLDSRRFRKVYVAKELLKAIKESQNFQELASQLQGALHHKKFDTTLASYMSLGRAKDIIDIGIFTLQTELVAEARRFRGVRVDSPHPLNRPGIYTDCADPIHPDYEGASIAEGLECGEYDMCLGCTQSRVFLEHLPRIAKRILQYESFRESIPRDAWEAMFGRKLARAYDVLNGWSGQDQVAEAWLLARSGSVVLPQIIVRG
jgi:hypothetical protein